jgi:hypothetical protein
MGGALLLGGCTMVKSVSDSLKPTNENVQQAPQKAVYRSNDNSDDNAHDHVNLVPSQKVPGE